MTAQAEGQRLSVWDKPELHSLESQVGDAENTFQGVGGDFGVFASASGP